MDQTKPGQRVRMSAAQNIHSIAPAASPEKLPDSAAAAARTSFYIYAYHLHFRLSFLFDFTNTFGIFSEQSE